MDLDRENPAFVLLPNAPPQLVDVKKQETGHFNWDHLENLEASLKPSQDDEDENGVEFRGEHALSFPGTPQSPKMNELDYFSDGHSPKNYEEMDNLNWRFKCQWAQSHNTSAFKLSSGDIKRLDLDNGTNEAVFTTINKYQGTCTCYCLIYLWNFTDKIVISDIDGTITKSDLLGHVMHWVGLEWTHPGVVQLYKKIDDNGYRLMYLSARCIGQANPTRNFLEGIEQDKEKLPAGPIILSPNSLITTINMEIIQKRPQVLKIANLKRLGELFRQQNPEAPCPFYAGFGNRVSDTETYRAIGIPDSRIFIVNPLGVIETPTGLKLSSGYTSLCEVVDSVFPPEYQKLSDGIGHSDFTFWRKEFPSETNS